METSLHRELKLFCAGPEARTEVRCGSYRIDAVVGDELVEIQHGSLAAIRDKIRRLLDEHTVRVVKPVVAGKLLVKRARKNGRVVERRRSPKRGSVLEVFHELVYFTKVFPHPRLTLELVLVDVEEWRYPGRGRRRRSRRGDFQVEDQKLLAIHDRVLLRTSDDLCTLAGCDLSVPFDTADLALRMGINRWVAQRVAYCLREMGAVQQVAKRGNTRIYQRVAANGAALAG
jgi:hypothetical protein